MKTILILNIGSSSIKYQVYKGEELLLKGLFERVKDFSKGIKNILALLEKNKIEIDAIGHRVVHGGQNSKSLLLTESVVKELDIISDLAPLHNIPEVKGIKICKKLLNVPNVAVFDTAFHQTMPAKAYTYAIPQRLAKKHKIRRYGFHGTSHNYVARKAAKLLGKRFTSLKIITCHLGNGCSMAAVDKGKSVDTSMGFTPLEGLVMGTRCGDLDPAIVDFIEKKEGLSPTDLDNLLNKKSGMLGICGHNDMRDIYGRMKLDIKARLAFEVFCYRIIKYIGAYAAAMNGVDAIVFTAGIGENAWYVREEIMKQFGFLGVKLDKKKNKNHSTVISDSRSKIKVMVVPTNEEYMIAEETKKFI